MTQATPEATTPAATTAPVVEAEPVVVEDTTDWKAEARKWEERAKSNKDKAAELDKLKAEQQTDLERETARAEAAEAKAADLLRRSVIAEKGIPESLHQFLTGSDEETLKAQAESLLAAIPAAAEAQGSGTPKPDLSQGGTGAASTPMALNGDPLLQALTRAVGA